MKSKLRLLCLLALVLVLALGTVSGAGAASLIGKARAKAIALDHAGYTASQATFIKAELDRDDGRRIYEVEFYVRDGAILEYDYQIDAYTGAILDVDRDVEASYTVKNIGLAAAKKAALADAGYTAGQVKFLKAKLDKDDGCYDIEFYVMASPTLEFDYEIDAKTGKVLSKDADVEGYDPAAVKIGREKAKAAALAHAGLTAGQVRFTKVKLDRDDGRLVYEVEFRLRKNRRIEYEYEIDARTGAVIDWDRDDDD